MNFFKALWEAICETTVEQIEEIKQAEPPPQEQSVFGDESAVPSYFDTFDITHSLYYSNPDEH